MRDLLATRAGYRNHPAFAVIALTWSRQAVFLSLESEGVTMQSSLGSRFSRAHRMSDCVEISLPKQNSRTARSGSFAWRCGPLSLQKSLKERTGTPDHIGDGWGCGQTKC